MSNNFSRDIEQTKSLKNTLYQIFGTRKAKEIKEKCSERAFEETGYSHNDFSLEIGDNIKKTMGHRILKDAVCKAPCFRENLGFSGP